MFAFRTAGRRTAASLITSSAKSRRCASRIEVPTAPPPPSPAPPFQVVDTCPAATCECRASPPGLDIDRKQNLNGLIGSYAEQVLLCTGRDDWKSRIEDEDDATLLRQLKGFLGKDGKYNDPYHNVLLTNSSFPTSRPPIDGQSDRSAEKPASTSAFLLPSFLYVPNISSEPDNVESLVRRHLQPTRPSSSDDHSAARTENKGTEHHLPTAQPLHDILVLICGHGGRDERCGKMGPLLRDEFEEKLRRRGFPVIKDAPIVAAEAASALGSARGSAGPAARVGLISHIGGHKFAGNVIIYVPPSFGENALAGKGIWYGRVGPEHVEGIIETTLVEGKVIKDMFRGGINQDRQILRL